MSVLAACMNITTLLLRSLLVDQYHSVDLRILDHGVSPTQLELLARGALFCGVVTWSLKFSMAVAVVPRSRFRIQGPKSLVMACQPTKDITPYTSAGRYRVFDKVVSGRQRISARGEIGRGESCKETVLQPQQVIMIQFNFPMLITLHAYILHAKSSCIIS
ncbi:hypothetical protein BDZ45DRAFT_321101 [Acephala macrosclerotiorum]|nr:hypothetical protein BDZ45DRAFT_321101 [Acephala macrosclerotiorum]